MSRKPVQLSPLRTIDFPPVETEERLKLTRFFKTIGEFMETDIEVVEVTTLRVKVSRNRTDVIAILSKIAAKQKQKEKERNVSSSSK